MYVKQQNKIHTHTHTHTHTEERKKPVLQGHHNSFRQLLWARILKNKLIKEE